MRKKLRWRHELCSGRKMRSILQGRTDLEQSTNQKPAFDGIRQIFCPSASPVMEKHDPRFFVRHVLMDGHDVDLFFEQRFQYLLQFILGYREVSIDNRIVVASGER